MPNLAVDYLGLKLKNPLIVASSGLSRNVKLIRQCEQAGAGAVVMKSIFEEDIRRKDKTFAEPSYDHPESAAYMEAEIGLLYGPRDYCEQISLAKKQVGIPVIASVNCASARRWAGYASQLQAAGADALELNLSLPSVDPETPGSRFEQDFCDIVAAVRSQVKLPLAVKMSGQLTAPQNVALRLVDSGADALVVFNRQSGLDIDLKTRKAFSAKGGQGLTTPHNIYYPLRWVAILRQVLPHTYISASGGVHDGDAFIKYLLAGAATVQVCSLLYRKGLDQIPVLLKALEKYMQANRFKTVDSLRGSLVSDLEIGSRTEQRREYLELGKGQHLEVDSTDGGGLIYESYLDEKEK